MRQSETPHARRVKRRSKKVRRSCLDDVRVDGDRAGVGDMPRDWKFTEHDGVSGATIQPRCDSQVETFRA